GHRPRAALPRPRECPRAGAVGADARVLHALLAGGDRRAAAARLLLELGGRAPVRALDPVGAAVGARRAQGLRGPDRRGGGGADPGPGMARDRVEPETLVAVALARLAAGGAGRRPAPAAGVRSAVQPVHAAPRRHAPPRHP